MTNETDDELSCVLGQAVEELTKTTRESSTNDFGLPADLNKHVLAKLKEACITSRA